MKKSFFILISILSLNATAQMSLGFVKNCMSYERASINNELYKKHFEETEKSIKTAQNPMMVGATAFSNEKVPANGEEKVLYLVDGSKKITEIYFVNGPKNDYTKNFTEVYNQMVSFFKNQTSFKSKKYNVDVVKFMNDKVFYYVYKLQETPVIVVSNYKIDDLYFQ